jgi:glutamine synthetase
MTVLNTIVAEQLNAFADAVNEKIQKNQQKEEAILATLIGYLPDCNKIIFNGDGYSQEWVAEAARRGLSNIASTPLALDAYASEQTRRLFAGQNVLDSTELAARHNVKLEVYVKRVQIEARVLGELAINQILPDAFNYQRELAENAHAVQNLALSPNPAHPQMAMVQEISDRTTRIRNKVSEMVEARKAANQIEDARARALQYEETVRPFFDTIRYEIDKLEDIVPDAQWPLLKYREMLFLR